MAHTTNVRKTNTRLPGLTWLSALAAAALCLSCNGTASPSSHDPGAVGLMLQVAPGTVLSSVSYTITGPASYAKAGTIDVSQSNVISALISPIPAGVGFTISLSATANGGGTTCAGTGAFDVAAGQTASVAVHLTCQEAVRTGAILVNGSLNVCPIIDGISASTDEVFVSFSIALGAQARDLDSAPAALGYRWTSSIGQLSDATAQNPQFTCTSAGVATITLTVSDGDPTPGCATTRSLMVTCTPGRGAGGSAGPAGGSTGSGGAAGGAGSAGSAGNQATGGIAGSGGVVSAGGTGGGVGGVTSAGGVIGSGGVTSTGGIVGSGGVVGSGGAVSAGGASGGALALAIYRVGDGTGSLVNTGNPVFVDRYSPAGTLLATTPLPVTASGTAHRLVASGTATSEGLMTRSADGRFLLLTGYDAGLPTSGLVSTSSTTTPRTVARIDAAGNVDTTTALSDFATGNNPRSVASSDGASLWVTGAGGGVRFAALGGTTSVQLSTTVVNLRQASIFGGQLYVSDSSGSAVRLGAVGMGLPTTAGQTITNVAGIPAGTGSPYGFFFADVDPSTPGVDVLYVADDSIGLTKYSLVGGTWTANGTVGTGNDAYRGVTGVVSGNGVTLYATRKGGSTAAGGGELVSIVDAGGYNGAFTAAPTLLATAAANTAFRGVALAP